MTQQPNDNELRIKLEEIFYPKFGEYKGVRPAAIVTLPSDLDAKKGGMRQAFDATINDILALVQDEILKARIEEAKFFRDTLSDREIRELSRQPTLATWQMHIGDLEAQLNQPNTNKEKE